MRKGAESRGRIRSGGGDDSGRRRLGLPRDELADFCRRNHIRRLSLFGSVLHGDDRPDSDVDLLVEFEPGHVPGLIRLAGMELELGELLGRKVDLRTPNDLSRYFRDEVLGEAEVQYAEG
jgi:predicted nucleotidyltransferase